MENRGRKHPCAVGGPIYRALQGTTKTNDNSQLFKEWGSRMPANLSRNQQTQQAQTHQPNPSAARHQQ